MRSPDLILPGNRGRGPAPEFTFDFPALDTVVNVVESGGVLWIRASRDSFSAWRRERFLHHLVAEGFVSERHQWLGDADLVWRVEPAAFMPGPGQIGRTRRAMLRLIGGTSLLWLVLMGLMLFLRPV